MNRDVPKGLMIIVILVGITLLFGSTAYKIVRNYNSRDYVETEAVFIYPGNYHVDEDGTKMYRLIYTYFVDGEQYHYTTDYSTSVIPEIGSKIKIKYNPNIPREVYSNSFDVLSIFQIIGAFFLCVSLMIMFGSWIWFRDIVMFFGTSSLIITFIANNFYTGYFILVLIILGVMCFASLVELILGFKNKKFTPLQDIKKDILLSKSIKQKKKQ